ncbi:MULTISPECIES: UDP-N-acetylmuramoyl-tripeptide--D-alanyl-D-alanine ligase [unclassified Prochlorococcus]|uniref:UDP-N-acetylmuramoyl-tripeptide--D-alanyl-D- alanine ligase n=1 Tax=unclassified Prochlorococcus TaxID=2627481 RepID=UPI00053399C0|nr:MULTISPECIES: UDP-N-acetylmuramoyl-tripeptide--D-alanyl-D-alanine ligase [unclassified Prochlorococcus]KGG15376.1 UDP-N-acetylmuramoylalanyl-D-glutamyl-2,6- diaminopimelate--D-alanyl-D-alanine ligase [Prochlorococcus sp. MIT 0602]KGG17654.1 UDP-N-acetylmuramoylalanyl-D-glutamyl-2,6- diaminopimelate--D-alanyl-D-alanine ligase [Prochlorococcus sp. MIT 0603]
MEISLRQLNDIWGEPYNYESFSLDDSLGKVVTDTRKLAKGNFFVPLLGANFDGHAFLEEAYLKGAQATVISNDCASPIPDGFLYWRVQDTLQAFQELALLHRQSLGIPVVAVTGSVGKTTTREMIHSALRSLGSVITTTENNNNDFGVPMTLLKATKADKAIIVEMGMRGRGQIERLSKCAQPDIAIITNIGTAHIALLGSRKNIALAKCEITSFLNPNGVVIIPEGDYLLEVVLKSKWKGRIIRVGVQARSTSSEVDISMHEYQDSNADYLGLLNVDNWSMTCNDNNFILPLEGFHNAQNFMLAMAVVKEFNLPFQRINKLNVELPTGRNTILRIGGITVLDQTYNASPESVIASLDLLVTKPGRHFAVLGKMYELGDHSIDYHKLVVKHAVRIGLKGVVICATAPESKEMYLAAKPLQYVELVSKPEEAFKYLKKWLKTGDHLLLKASRKVSLEKLLPLLVEYY